MLVLYQNYKISIIYMMIIRRNADNIILNKDSKKTDFFPNLLNLFSEKGSTYVLNVDASM